MPDSDETSLLLDLWHRQRTWSKAADRAKSEVSRYRLTSLFLVVIAAGLGAAAPVVGGLHDVTGRTFGLVAGVALGLLPVVRRRLDVPIYQTWSRLRSVSEALKSEVYTYRAGVDPYRHDDRVTVLRLRSTDILRKGDDLLGRLHQRDRTPRPLPEVADVPTYLALRVEQQTAGYYLRQARQMSRRAHRVRITQNVLAGCAVVLGVISSAGWTGVAPWIGVIGTVSGAVIAHSAAGRYGFLELEYLRTAEQLARLVGEYRSSRPGSDRDDWLVAECERVISFQNEAWMAELVTTRQEEIEATIPPPV